MSRTHLSFHRLTVVDEGDEVVIGRPDTDSYAVFPQSAGELLVKLCDGMSISEAADWYEAREGEPVDMDDFVDTLTELGFLRDSPDNTEQPAPAATPVRLVWLGRALFAPAAMACYVALAVCCAWVLITVPQVRPQPLNLFFTDSLLVIEVILLIGGTVGMGIHEGFHVLAGRRLGMPSRLSIGARLYFVVFETTLQGLLGVPRRKRYLPFLAGMLADGVLFCALTLIAALLHDPSQVLPWSGRLALALAFLTMLRFAWQFYFFLRTDLYYVVTTALGCQDLHGATRAYLHNRLRRFVFRRWSEVDETAWTERDRRFVPVYGPLMIGGVVVLLGMAAVAMLPAALKALDMLAEGLFGSGAVARVLDAVAFLILGFAPVTVALGIHVRAWLRRLNRRRSNSAQGLAQKGNP
ncbi:hypothetical protein ALI144C_07315 [Actinosynnema sp. ALI-1.44]|uniref:hypothetical protein n=1 Tax=Actinosynnema sp. ALI-1.44 TaxID=1933779 RepID=UPI00097CBE36|nr:hypothetical protein [Actinosynnema sp. ALI-1.44]ONI88248.1 hypothetical protein ALI144C_07315 [Actinosynnema sp. ALI-1.44]